MESAPVWVDECPFPPFFLEQVERLLTDMESRLSTHINLVHKEVCDLKVAAARRASGPVVGVTVVISSGWMGKNKKKQEPNLQAL